MDAGEVYFGNVTGPAEAAAPGQGVGGAFPWDQHRGWGAVGAAGLLSTRLGAP